MSKDQVCQHANATITLFDEAMTRYHLVDGKVGESKDLEPQPLGHVDISCPECGLRKFYEDWTKAPEPIRAYVENIFQQEYGE